ncbi:MAG TPA: hypothetical protein VID29_10575 [Solirubrobacteraceae bacterium]|jgi:hypothetical protein
MRIQVVLAAGVLLIAALLGLTLSRRPLIPIGVSGPANPEGLTVVSAGTRVCQSNEVLPRATTAIRLALDVALGPAISVQARSGAHVLTQGSVDSGWRGRDVTVAVGRVPRTTPHVELCFAIAPSSEPVGLLGVPTSAATAARNANAKLPGRVGIEYLRPSGRSWWSLALGVLRRMGLGRAPAGTWIALLVGALMASAALAASWAVLRRLR